MKIKHALMPALATFAATLGFRYWRDKSLAPKLSNSTILSTDSDGNKLIEVRGVGGKDNGMNVQGYQLPEKFSDVIFPLKVIVKPNENIFGDWIFGGGKTVTLNKGNSDSLNWEGTGEYSGTYIVSYPEVKQKALKSV